VKKFLKIILLLVISTMALVYWTLQPQTPPASQAWVNGTILTMDDNQPTAEAVFVRGDRIVALGSRPEIESMMDAQTVIHDLAGTTMLPGLVDAHSHFPASGMALYLADLRSPPVGIVKTIPQLLERVAAQVQKTPEGEWVGGYGYDQLMLSEGRHPSLQELDSIAPNHPVFLMHVSGHMGVANSAAFKLVGFDQLEEDPAGGHIHRDSNGIAIGLVEENAALAFQKPALDLSLSQFIGMVDFARNEYLSNGVTTAQASNASGPYIQGLSLAMGLNKIPQRLVVFPDYDSLGLELIEGTAKVADLAAEQRHIGAIKLVADGSIQGYTGYLTHPYHSPHKGDDLYRGYPRIPLDELKRKVLNIAQAGFQAVIHGNGDASIDDILDAIEYVQVALGQPVERTILIHAQMARPDQLQRMQELDVTPSFFVAHTYYWGDQHRDLLLGSERASHISPLRSAENIGLRFSTHLDTPIVPMQPLLSAWSSVNRLTTTGKTLGENERISVVRALKAITIDAAWQVHLDHEIGSISPGKYADFTLLDQNPLLHPKTLKDIQIVETIIGGVSYFQGDKQHH
jgi:predicted amidohydrolase YtcJ